VFVPTDDDVRPDYWMHDARSLADLDAMGDALADGVRVVLYGPAGRQWPAVLRFQAEVNCWIAYPARKP